MFWDNVAWAYDIFADGINRKANRALRAVVAEAIRPGETVLECACGTGLLSGAIAERCGSLVATDLSEKMLRRAERKCARYGNVRFERGDILRITFPNESFDAVVAGNVIHLLDEPCRALAELDRVCRRGGRLIIPTYMNETERGTTNSVSGAIGKAGRISSGSSRWRPTRPSSGRRDTGMGTTPSAGAGSPARWRCSGRNEPEGRER